ncbi:MAG: hypothetical protein COB46_14595 [Rhodospirillaceae bacterium]|nr:MAG: hypothetical protein COB46_14595 [Rhodospirillaceae bacterium]
MLTKIIFTIVIAYLGWRVFSVIKRLQDQRAKQAEKELRSGEAKRSGVEDMVECKTCNTYVQRGSKACGKDNCPF